VLGGARPPGMPARDIALDLTEDGHLLLDWPAAARGKERPRDAQVVK